MQVLERGDTGHSMDGATQTPTSGLGWGQESVTFRAMAGTRPPQKLSGTTWAQEIQLNAHNERVVRPRLGRRKCGHR